MELIELDPNSRFKVSNVPMVAPGKCALCGSSGGDDRQFVDFGFQLDIYGAVYFCTYCMTELAKVLGFSPASEFQAALENQAQEISDLDDMYVEVKVKYDAARTLLRNCRCDDSNSDDPIVESTESDPEPDDGESVSSDDETAGADSESDESSDSEGSDDIPESGSDATTSKSKSKRANSSSG